MSKKQTRITAASDTIAAFKKGFYVIGTRQVDVTALHQQTMASYKLYSPKMLDEIYFSKASEMETTYQLFDLPVVSALKLLVEAGVQNIGVLNFASAKNPGGGFLNGAKAQEESLAMCSNLYLTQTKNQDYYDANRNSKTPLYTDYMIYSDKVVFIREDEDCQLEQPLVAAVLTAPAVNMGVYKRREDSDEEYGYQVMKERMRKVLKVFYAEGHKVLLLGAYGCGVFQNDPYRIGLYFGELLKEEKLENYFDKIYFAVFDSSKNRRIYNQFEKGLREKIVFT